MTPPASTLFQSENRKSLARILRADFYPKEFKRGVLAMANRMLPTILTQAQYTTLAKWIDNN